MCLTNFIHVGGWLPSYENQQNRVWKQSKTMWTVVLKRRPTTNQKRMCWKRNNFTWAPFFVVGNSNKKNAMHVLENKLIYVDGNWRGNVTPEGAARPCTTLIKARQPIPLSLRAVRPWPPETNMWSDTVTQHAGGGDTVTPNLAQLKPQSLKTRKNWGNMLFLTPPRADGVTLSLRMSVWGSRGGARGATLSLRVSAGQPKFVDK